MAKRTGTTAPRLDPVRLIGLTDGDEGALDAHDSVEGLRFADLDLSHRDLSGITISESLLAGIRADQTDFRAASFLDSRLERWDAPILLAPRSRLRDVELEGSRVGSADCGEGTIHLHLDRGVLGRGGGMDATRDPEFIPLIEELYQFLPE